eukprot:3582598-Pyramimonas_sp.AAC.1
MKGLGAVVGPAWAVEEPSKAVLGPSGGPFGLPRDRLGCLFGHRGVLKVLLEPLGGILGRLVAILDVSCVVLS